MIILITILTVLGLVSFTAGCILIGESDKDLDRVLIIIAMVLLGVALICGICNIACTPRPTKQCTCNRGGKSFQQTYHVQKQVYPATTILLIR